MLYEDIVYLWYCQQVTAEHLMQLGTGIYQLLEKLLAFYTHHLLTLLKGGCIDKNPPTCQMFAAIENLTITFPTKSYFE